MFADLGLPQPEETLLKADLAIRISQLNEQRGLNQKEAAALLGITQPYISKLTHGQLRGFSIGRLLRFLVALDQDVELVISPKSELSARSCIRTLILPSSPVHSHPA